MFWEFNFDVLRQRKEKLPSDKNGGKEKVVQSREKCVKLVIKKSGFLPIKICYSENWVVSTSDVAQQLYNAWDAPKQMNWITNWICPLSKERLLEECCKVILMNRVRGGVDLALILLPFKYQYE